MCVPECVTVLDTIRTLSMPCLVFTQKCLPGEPQHSQLVRADLRSQLDEFSIVGGSQASRGREVDDEDSRDLRVFAQIDFLACRNMREKPSSFVLARTCTLTSKLFT